jgi:hypothetical protein
VPVEEPSTASGTELVITLLQTYCPLSRVHQELAIQGFCLTTRRHIAFVGAAALSSVLGLTRPGKAQGGLSDTSPKVLSFAVPDLETPSPYTAEAAHLVAETIIGDLRASGRFTPVDLTNSSVPASPFLALPPFDAWRSAGVQVLIRGRIRLADGKLTTEFFIWDIASRRVIHGQVYVGRADRADQWQWMAHSMSGVVYQDLTGEQRNFCSLRKSCSLNGPRR